DAKREGGRQLRGLCPKNDRRQRLAGHRTCVRAVGLRQESDRCATVAAASLSAKSPSPDQCRIGAVAAALDGLRKPATRDSRRAVKKLGVRSAGAEFFTFRISF